MFQNFIFFIPNNIFKLAQYCYTFHLKVFFKECKFLVCLAKLIAVVTFVSMLPIWLCIL